MANFKFLSPDVPLAYCRLDIDSGGTLMKATLLAYRNETNSSNSSRSHNRRIHLPARVLSSFKLATGDFVIVSKSLEAGEALQNLDLGERKIAKFAVAVAWPSFVSDAQSCQPDQGIWQDLVDLQEGQSIDVVPMLSSGLQGAELLSVELSFEEQTTWSPADKLLWTAHAKQALSELKCVICGQPLEVSINGKLRKGRIRSLEFDEARRSAVIGLFSPTTRVALVSEPATLKNTRGISSASMQDSIGDAYLSVGGLDTQIELIKELVELPLTRRDLYQHFGLIQPRGILLHGPPGTGKTLLASSIASSLNLPCFNVSGAALASPYHGETEAKLRDIFQQAQETAPSIVILDEIDVLAPRREDAGEVERRLVAELLVLMDGLNSKSQAAESHIMVIACTNRPNAIDSALRRPGRFDKEIEIGVPNAEARLAILKVHLRHTPHTFSDQDLQDIAARTHGFVGADMASLIHSAGLSAMRRCIRSSLEQNSMRVEQGDMDAALVTTRPSAMRDVLLELPKVFWKDIGGQAETVQKLRECVEWPISRKATFQRLGIRPPSGILLYGPPGCSKTMLARAMATEAGLNFIAVKGPEVFNKYVGESEKQIRTLFQKARAAAPSILFLDEVDAIATSRSHGESSSTDRILTSLLTELDGIEPLRGVVLLAATNRPWSIDPALLRPGRLDRLLYVSMPDAASRKAIFALNISRMSVGTDIDLDVLANLSDGCTGAEITAICQDAALAAMNEQIDVSAVDFRHFAAAAQFMRRRVTAESLQQFEDWLTQAEI